MNVPRGYIYKPGPKSVAEAVSQASNDKVKYITKTAIKDYIASFFNSDGAKRNLLSGFSTASLQYLTDKSYNNEQDATQRYTQLAIFFEELKERLPFILVIDNGIQIVKSSLGVNLDSYKIVDGVSKMVIPVIRKVNINVVVGTRDIESCDIISQAISILFNEMHFVGQADRIAGNYEQGDKWEVRVPHEPIEQSQSQHDHIGDDPVDSIWWTETSLNNTWFENFIEMDSDSITADVQHLCTTSPLAIVFPTSIRLNTQHNLVVTGHDGNIQVNIDNPEIANFDPQSGTITPRRLGTFTIRVMRGISVGSEVGLLAEKACEVVFR